MFSFQTFQILFFLIPGLLSAIIMNSFLERKEQKQFEKFTEALIFSLVIYVTYSCIMGDATIPIEIKKDNFSINYNDINLIIILGLSVFWGTLAGVFIFYDWILKLARKANFTKKTARPSVWYDTFADERRYVTVRCGDGTEMTGYPLHFSDSIEEPSLYLTDVQFIVGKKENRRYSELDAHGILLTPESQIKSIIFHNKE